MESFAEMPTRRLADHINGKLDFSEKALEIYMKRRDRRAMTLVDIAKKSKERNEQADAILHSALCKMLWYTSGDYSIGVSNGEMLRRIMFDCNHPRWIVIRTAGSIVALDYRVPYRLLGAVIDRCNFGLPFEEHGPRIADAAHEKWKKQRTEDKTKPEETPQKTSADASAT